MADDRTAAELMTFSGPSSTLAAATKPTDKIALESLPPAVQAWLRPVALRSQNTHDAYHLSISLWLRWCIANGIAADEAGMEEAEAWAEHLEVNRGNSKRTVNARLSAVSSLYNRLLVQNKIGFNPFASMITVKVRTSHLKTPAVSQSDVAKMLAVGASLSHSADHAILELLFTTGARAFEIGDATVGDLRSDEHGSKLHVIRKGGDEQDLPVSPRALAAIKKANADRGDLADEARLLLGPRKAKYSRHTISRLVHRVAVAAKIDPGVAKFVTAHTTRRTSATQLDKKNVDLRTIQTLLGHKDPRTTEGYIRAEQDREKHASAALILSSLFH